MATLRIGVLAFPGCLASEVFGFVDVLRIAGQVSRALGGDEPFDCQVVSPRRRVTAASAIDVHVRSMTEHDLLVVPGFEVADPRKASPRAAELNLEVGVIRGHSDRGLPVASVCLGAFLLAEAGVLDARRATTSWRYADQLATAYPSIDVRAEELVVTDRGVTTSAAYSAMYDMALALVQDYAGPRTADRTARLLLLDAARRSQLPYISHDLQPEPGTPLVSAVRSWLVQHLEEPYSLERLAAACHMSTRTLLRQFKDQTGMSPRQQLILARVRRAQSLLEVTDLSLGEVHRRVGYTDSGAFRAVFARHVGVTPSAYRASFRSRKPD